MFIIDHFARLCHIDAGYLSHIKRIFEQTSVSKQLLLNNVAELHQ